MQNQAPNDHWLVIIEDNAHNRYAQVANERMWNSNLRAIFTADFTRRFVYPIEITVFKNWQVERQQRVFEPPAHNLDWDGSLSVEISQQLL